MKASGTITIEQENGIKSIFKCDNINLNARSDHNIIYSGNRDAHLEMGVKWIQIHASDRSDVGKIYGEKQLNNIDQSSKHMSAMFCNHANESPYGCPCDLSCYCKQYACKNKGQQ